MTGWKTQPFEDVPPFKHEVIFHCHLSFRGVGVEI